MDTTTRQQLLRLSRDFYAAHASGFDASRGHEPWPGWDRLLADLERCGALPDTGGALRVLDVGCGNARLASFFSTALAGTRRRLRYVGVDANAALLAAAKQRLGAAQPTGGGATREVELIEADFLTPPVPGSALPRGPFDCVALFGVLHHVPGRDWRTALVRQLVRRARPGGLIAVAAWQFAGRERFDRRRVAWSALGPVLGTPIDEAELEPGDALLRFGADPDRPPRYCHQVDEAELDALAGELGRREGAAGVGWDVEVVDDYRADGAEGDLNRYLILQRRGEPPTVESPTRDS